LALAASAPAAEQRAARLRAAERAQRDGRLEDAEAHLWAAVELSANDEQPPLLVALEEVYTQSERWADLAVALHHHASVAPDEAERVALDARRVRVLTHRLATPVLAIEAAQAALARHGHAPVLVAALAEAARAAGDAVLLADTLAEQAALTEEVAARD